MAIVSGIGLTPPQTQQLVPAEMVASLIVDIERELAELNDELVEATQAADAAERRLQNEGADPAAIGRSVVQIRHYLDQLSLEADGEIAELLDEAQEQALAQLAPAAKPLAEVVDLAPPAVPAPARRAATKPKPKPAPAPAPPIATPVVAPAEPKPNLPPPPLATPVVATSEAVAIATPEPVLPPPPVVADSAFWAESRAASPKEKAEKALGIMPVQAIVQVAAVVLILVVILLRIG